MDADDVDLKPITSGKIEAVLVTVDVERYRALAESHTKLIGALNNRGVSYHFANHYSEEALTLFDSCDLYPCLDDRRMLAEARKL